MKDVVVNAPEGQQMETQTVLAKEKATVPSANESIDVLKEAAVATPTPSVPTTAPPPQSAATIAKAPTPDPALATAAATAAARRR